MAPAAEGARVAYAPGQPCPVSREGREDMSMRAARMHGYKEPLRIEEVPVPEANPDEILLKVAATGMCRSDYQLLDGYFRAPFPVEFPYIPGHEVTGRVVDLRGRVPTMVGYSEG